jgi:hypothetical protein
VLEAFRSRARGKDNVYAADYETIKTLQIIASEVHIAIKNIAKGIRRIDALCEGDIEGTKRFLGALPQALETSAETVTLALDQTVHEIELAEKRESEARDKIWRENFCPHAIILTERTEGLYS